MKRQSGSCTDRQYMHHCTKGGSGYRRSGCNRMCLSIQLRPFPPRATPFVNLGGGPPWWRGCYHQLVAMAAYTTNTWHQLELLTPAPSMCIAIVTVSLRPSCSLCGGCVRFPCARQRVGCSSTATLYWCPSRRNQDVLSQQEGVLCRKVAVKEREVHVASRWKQRGALWRAPVHK